jgi:hypothetical protein
MKLQTSCSLHLLFSQPNELAQAVACLMRFLGDQGVRDGKFCEEFQAAAIEAIQGGLKHCHAGLRDRFVEIKLRINSVEVQLEIVSPSCPDASSGRPPSANASPATSSLAAEERRIATGDVQRDGMDVVVLKKSLGELTWSYEPGVRENP